MSSQNDPPFSRTTRMALDIITVTDPSHIVAIEALPEVERVAELDEDPHKLPWLFRWFFPKTRFYNPALRGWFLPFRAAADPTYAPCRAFLDARFAEQRDTSAAVAETADLLTDSKQVPSDRQLADAAIRAIWAYMVPPNHPPIPDEQLASASAQLGELTDSFLPWRLYRCLPATASIYSYGDSVLRGLGLRGGSDGSGEADGTERALPDACVTDVAHVLFAMAKNAPPVLRRLGEGRTGEGAREALCAVGPTQNVVRMVRRASTLGGMLADDAPAQPGRTTVLLDIRAAAAQTGDLGFVFGSGTGQRECAARGVLERYFRDVAVEVDRRRGGVGGTGDGEVSEEC